MFILGFNSMMVRLIDGGEGFSILAKSSFNSMMVRLIEVELGIEDALIKMFQFHDGAIDRLSW